MSWTLRCLGIGLSVTVLAGPLSGQDVSREEFDRLKEQVSGMEQRKTEAAKPPAGMMSKLASMLTWYGFLRVDMAYDDSEPDDNQLIQFIPSEDSSLTGPAGSHKSDDSFTIYTRLTRLGFDLTAPEIKALKGRKLTGKLETDFYNTASDSRNAPRIRHAYGKVSGDTYHFLFGQTFDLFSPLMPSTNPDGINWNAGNPGDRRPQARFSYEPKVGDKGTFIAQGALALQGGIDQANNDADGILNGEDSGRPQLQGRAAFRTKVFEDKATFESGVWIVRGWEQIDGRVNGEKDFEVDLIGLDAYVPIVKDTVWAKGELWTGKNLDDLRGGIGQGINGTTGAEIESTGYWLELGAKVRWGTCYGGYSTDDPENGDVPGGASGKVRNEVLYVGTVVKHYDPFEFGFDYSYWETRYKGGLSNGNDNRFRLYFAYNF